MTRRDPSALSVENALRELEARAAGTPYAVERTADGAVVTLSIVDASLATQLHERGFNSVYSLTLAFNEADRSYTREARSQEIEYVNRRGAAGVQASLKRTHTRGTVREIQMGKGAVPRADGGSYDYAFDSREITEFVDGTLAELGWQRKMDRATRIGVGFAIGGGVFALLAAVAGIVVAIVL